MLSSPWRNTSSKPITTRPARSSRAVFNAARLSIYAAVFLFGMICLGMAGSFQHILASSDLTRFVPFALFVCSASALCILVLVLFGLIMRERNPISTRGELFTFGTVGLFWFVLGVFMASSESQTADVECFSDASSTSPLDDDESNFHTEQYHAMYRVLMVFALLNAIIVILASALMLFLAVRKHRNGDQHMWYAPITSCAWLSTYKPNKRSNSQKSILPRNNSGYKGATRPSEKEAVYASEKPSRKNSSRPSRERSHRSQRSQGGGEGHTRNRSTSRRPSQNRAKIYEQHRRMPSGNASIVAPRTNVDFENGAMVEPARAAYPSGRERHR